MTLTTCSVTFLNEKDIKMRKKGGRGFISVNAIGLQNVHYDIIS